MCINYMCTYFAQHMMPKRIKLAGQGRKLRRLVFGRGTGFDNNYRRPIYPCGSCRCLSFLDERRSNDVWHKHLPRLYPVPCTVYLLHVGVTCCGSNESLIPSNVPIETIVNMANIFQVGIKPRHALQCLQILCRLHWIFWAFLHPSYLSNPLMEG